MTNAEIQALIDRAVAEAKLTTVGYISASKGKGCYHAWTVPPAGTHWDNLFQLLKQARAGLDVAPPPPPPPSATSGKPLFMPKTDGSTDAPMDNIANRQWFLDHWHRAVLYLDRWPWFLPQSHKYVDVQAIYNPTHPDHAGAPPPDMSLVLKDSVTGKPLFVDWGSVVNGQLPQYAADVGSFTWRQELTSRCKTILATGHRGIHFDDVNLGFNFSDGTSRNRIPLNPRTALAYTLNQYKDDFCGMLEQMVASLPGGVEISHNSRWFDSPNHDGQDPYVERQIKACGWVTIERGFTDQGLQGGTGEWSTDRLFKFVDHVHALGRSVVWMSYANPTDKTSIEANLAAYWLTRENRDMVCGGGKLPADWNPLYDIDLGAAKGPRTRSADGLFRRDFDHGTVLLNEPGAATKTVLGVTLAARQGKVIIS